MLSLVRSRWRPAAVRTPPSSIPPIRAGTPGNGGEPAYVLWRSDRRASCVCVCARISLGAPRGPEDDQGHLARTERCVASVVGSRVRLGTESLPLLVSASLSPRLLFCDSRLPGPGWPLQHGSHTMDQAGGCGSPPERVGSSRRLLRARRALQPHGRVGRPFRLLAPLLALTRTPHDLGSGAVAIRVRRFRRSMMSQFGEA